MITVPVNSLISVRHAVIDYIGNHYLSPNDSVLINFDSTEERNNKNEDGMSTNPLHSASTQYVQPGISPADVVHFCFLAVGIVAASVATFALVLLIAVVLIRKIKARCCQNRHIRDIYSRAAFRVHQ